MFYEDGCHGRVQVGSLPDIVCGWRLPGEWLEFSTLGPSWSPYSAQRRPHGCNDRGELVRMLAEIPAPALPDRAASSRPL
jgi:hypothetical protein